MFFLFELAVASSSEHIIVCWNISFWLQIDFGVNIDTFSVVPSIINKNVQNVGLLAVTNKYIFLFVKTNVLVANWL